MQHTSYEFGPFVLVPAESQLWCEERQIHLPPKAFDLLVTLVAAGGHLVEKSELIRTVWRDTHVEEANLAQTVSVVRKALGAVPGGSLFVETVPKRGYRFAVEVRRNDHFTKECRIRPRPRGARWRKSVLSVGALVGAALVCVFLYRTLAGQ